MWHKTRRASFCCGKNSVVARIKNNKNTFLLFLKRGSCGAPKLALQVFFRVEHTPTTGPVAQLDRATAF